MLLEVISQFVLVWPSLAFKFNNPVSKYGHSDSRLLVHDFCDHWNRDGT